MICVAGRQNEVLRSAAPGRSVWWRVDDGRLASPSRGRGRGIPVEPRDAGPEVTEEHPVRFVSRPHRSRRERRRRPAAGRARNASSVRHRTRPCRRRPVRGKQRYGAPGHGVSAAGAGRRDGALFPRAPFAQNRVIDGISEQARPKSRRAPSRVLGPAPVNGSVGKIRSLESLNY